MGIKDSFTNITISIAEYKRLLQIEQRMEMIKNTLEMDKYFSGDDLKKMLGVKKEGEQ